MPSYAPIRYYYTWLLHENMTPDQMYWHIKQALKEGQISLPEYNRLFSHIRDREMEDYGE